MKTLSKILPLVVFMTFVSFGLYAQVPEEVDIMTEAGEGDEDPPLDGVVEERLIMEHRILPFRPIREADRKWEKRLWRVIDVREKMNLPFAYPVAPLITILMDAALNGEINAYDPQDDKFSIRFSPEEVGEMSGSYDTVEVINPETYEATMQVTYNEINPADVKRFRIKEVWYFDAKDSRVYSRILGIAPLLDVTDDEGNFKYEKVMFWVYYPECREMLARHQVFIEGNDAATITWENLFEMRKFSSTVFKESNLYDRRLNGYLSGVDRLLEGEKIKAELFNFEQDLWSY